MTSKVIYAGSLRTEAEHLKSGAKIITDAKIINICTGAKISRFGSGAKQVVLVVWYRCKNQ